MGTTAHKGPIWSTGQMEYLASSFGAPVPDYNPDAAPSSFYQGLGIPDVRFFLQKDKLNGFTGVQPLALQSAGIEACDAVPAAYGAAKIAAAAHTINGTPMTLVSTNSAGIATNVPIAPFSGAINGSSTVIAPIVLDYGFAFGTTGSGFKSLTVADTTQFTVGMPLIIPGALTSSTALITSVVGIASPTLLYMNDFAGVTGTLAVGTGDNWPGAPLTSASQQSSKGHLPSLAGGPGLFLDPSQTLSRGVSITCNSASGTGGAVKVSGWDIYWQPMNETITIAPGTALTAYGKKAFKAIKSVTPLFTDATYTYSVGTSDVFGYPFRARNWERTSGSWAAGFLTGSAGFTAFAAPASGDVRGTFQVSAQGGGTGYGTTNSNGAVSSLVMTGNRLVMFQSFSTADTLQATPFAPQSMFGATQT